MDIPAGISVASLVCVVLTALVAPSAWAVGTRFEQSAFGSFGGAGAVAVDQSGGDVYVLDSAAANVQRFDADGNPVAFSALSGQNVLNGSDAGPDADQTPANGFSFDAASQLAVDASGTATDGTIYVADSNNQVVDVFAASGAYLGQLDGSGTPQGRWADSGAYPCGVAVGTDGKVYVSTGTGSQIDRFAPAGSPVANGDYDAQIDGVPFGSCGLAVDSSGAVHAAPTIFGASGPLVKYAASDFGASSPAGTQVAANATAVAVNPTDDHVLVDEGDKATEYDSAGTQVGASFGKSNLTGSHGIAIAGSSDRVYASDGPSTQVHVFGAAQTVPTATTNAAASVDESSATLRATVDPDGEAVTDCHFDYGTDSSNYDKHAPCAPDPGSGSGDVDVSAALTDLEPGVTYHYRVVAVNANGTTTGDDVSFLTISRPEVETLFVQPITTTTATIAGQVNPHNQDGTTYHFEWGLDDQYGNQAPAADAAVPTGGEFVHLTHELTGLQQGTTYHFRLVATNAIGTSVGEDHTFETLTPRPAPAPCSNAAIRAQQHAEHLPDCRAYEKVTPDDKNGNEVTTYETSRGPLYAGSAPSGDRVRFTVAGSYPGADADARGAQMIALRDASGWTVRGLAPPLDPGYGITQSAVLAVSDDYRKALVHSTRALTAGAVSGQSNLYLRDIDSGTYQLVVTAPDPDIGQIPFIGGSRDFSRIYFMSVQALAPGTPPGDQVKLYRWTGDAVEYISRINAAYDLRFREYLAANQTPVSDDGSRILYIDRSSTCNTVYRSQIGFAPQPVAMTDVTGEPAVPVQGCPWASSRDGSTVIFGGQGLTDASDAKPEQDLYRANADTGQLETLTVGTDYMGGGTARVFGASDDAQTVYFSDRTDFEHPRLYVNRGDQTHKVLSAFTVTEQAYGLPHQGDTGSQTSPSGRYFLFQSAWNLTGIDLGHLYGQYLYDADTQRITCVTCRSDGSFAEGGVSRVSDPGDKRYLLENGSVYFETTTALVSRDTNGKSDVYEWRDGSVALISSGQSASESYFVDASADGSDVFIATRSQLVGRDRDDLFDVYDARVGGGALATTDGAAEGCSGDQCQGDAAPAPSLTPAVTISFAGSGDEPGSVPRRTPTTVSVSKRSAVVGTRARLRVAVPGKGVIKVSGPGLRTVKRTLRRASTSSVTVGLTARARRTLTKRRTLKLKATVSFASATNGTSKVSLSLVFKAPSSKKAS